MNENSRPTKFLYTTRRLHVRKHRTCQQHLFPHVGDFIRRIPPRHRIHDRGTQAYQRRRSNSVRQCTVSLHHLFSLLCRLVHVAVVQQTQISRRQLPRCLFFYESATRIAPIVTKIPPSTNFQDTVSANNKIEKRMMSGKLNRSRLANFEADVSFNPRK